MREAAGWLLLEGATPIAQVDEATVDAWCAGTAVPPEWTPETIMAACAGRMQAAASRVLRPGARPDRETIHASRRVWDRVLRAAATAEPPARFMALVGHRRNGPLVAGLLRGLIAPQAVVGISRERRRQILWRTVRVWAQARFPQLMRTHTRLLHANPWYPPAPVELPVRWPPECTVVATPSVLPPAGAYALGLAASLPLTAGPWTSWQQVLASVCRVQKET